MEVSTFFYLLGSFALFSLGIDLIHFYYKEKNFKYNQEYFKKLKSEKSNQDFDDKIKPM